MDEHSNYGENQKNSIVDRGTFKKEIGVVIKLVSVVGARPQFVKLAAICRVLPAHVDHQILHTGQHYDQSLSGAFFTGLEITGNITNLGIGSGPHGEQTGLMMGAIESFLSDGSPNWTLVFGDTNSTLAAAIASAKLHVPVAHLEAGLRSYNRRMPEEINRILVDHSSELCLAPSTVAMEQLGREGLADRSLLVGDVMADVLLEEKKRVEGDPPEMPWNVIEGNFALATFHRQELATNVPKLRELIQILQKAPLPVYLLAHPRLAKVFSNEGIFAEASALRVLPPLAYHEMLWALMHARALVTDSGGLQKEAFILGVPTATVRTETEWPETIDLGWNRLIWDDLAELAAFLREPPTGQAEIHPYGDGHAAETAVEALLSWGK